MLTPSVVARTMPNRLAAGKVVQADLDLRKARG
jgi:hypothetical protein